jgi:hypothetical protein
MDIPLLLWHASHKPAGSQTIISGLSKGKQEAIMSNITTSLSLCPRCHSTRIIPILYGLPTPEAYAQVERGDFLLGGQIIEADSPWWACQFCYNRFREAESADLVESTFRYEEAGVLA